MTTDNNGAYTRYVYGPNYVQSYSTVNNVADDKYFIQVFDGLGRTYAVGGNHPGSYATYKAQLTVFDLMGRAVKQSNPTEINASWVPEGEDSAGWLYTLQTYDWKGRPLLTTNTDTSTKSASYGGCGCAGHYASRVAFRISAMIASGSTPSASPSKLRIRRWRSAGEATWRTSSIDTAYRPSSSARIFAARIVD